MPDMKAFVDAAHEQGVAVLLWYAMSLVGEQSELFPAMQGKFLRSWDGQGASVLDPRYPEVREHIIGTYRSAMQEWGIDGFKLDFLGFFVATDTTVLEATDGRDFASVNEATDRLMTDVMAELRLLDPDVMIEFRQRYIGPLMRKYGNMFRAADCPNAAVENRVRTVDLRLLSGDTAVHSDMLMWHADEPVEAAALQLLNVLFAVPQLSVRLEGIPPAHRQMIAFQTAYWRDNRSVLLDGAFEARSPLANYPLVTARAGHKRIIALYAERVVTVDEGGEGPLRELDVVNAKAGGRVVLDVVTPLGRCAYRITDVLGRPVDTGTVTLDAGPAAFDVPPSGMLSLARSDG
jgi:alpha-galactosidase